MILVIFSLFNCQFCSFEPSGSPGCSPHSPGANLHYYSSIPDGSILKANLLLRLQWSKVDGYRNYVFCPSKFFYHFRLGSDSFWGSPRGPQGSMSPISLETYSHYPYLPTSYQIPLKPNDFHDFFSWIRIRLTKKPHKTKGIFAKNAVLLGIHIYAPGVDIWSIFFDDLWF